MSRSFTFCAFFSLSLLPQSPTFAEATAELSRITRGQFARGGQFKDLILPTPVVGELDTENLWGGANVLPREKDNGIEDDRWCYWGGNPLLEADGKYHMAICRWPESKGHQGWYHSEVAHCVSGSPTGPYRVTHKIIQGHNPEVQRLADGTFALHLADNKVHKARRMEGPWREFGKIQIQSRGFSPNNFVGTNLTTELRPDNSVLLMQKNGDVSISRSDMTGPFQKVASLAYARGTGYAEDPIVWRSLHQYHAIYNHAQDRRSAYMRSLDGIHWRHEPGEPYDTASTYYADGTKNEWYKLERPKVIQDRYGRATHLTLAVLDVPKGKEQPNDSHSSKHVILPLVVERKISLVDGKPTSDSASRFTIRIEAEDGFAPTKEVKVESLKLGSSDMVNRGGGGTAVDAVPDGEDLLVTFEGSPGISRQDYDWKLLGETSSEQILFGYALLPSRSTTEASLIVLPPKFATGNGKVTIESSIENWGLERSAACTLQVIQHDKQEEKIVATRDMPELEPYESWPLSIETKSNESTPREFRIVVRDDLNGDELWHYVDDSSSEVSFSGNWSKRSSNDEEGLYMSGEHVTTHLGDSVTFSFDGVRARALGRIGRDMGHYAVYLDDIYQETIGCNYGSANKTVLYQTPLLPAGKHVLRMKKVTISPLLIVSIARFHTFHGVGAS